jgi:hypothetical protein
MNSTKAIIGKNLVLLSILAITVLTFLNRSMSWQSLIIMQLVLGLIYAFLSYYEYNNASYKASLPMARFPYYPGGFFMFRAIKIGMFLMFAIVLANVPSVVKILYPICLIIALTEIIISVLKYKQNLCYISIFANYILVARENTEKIFANELANLEYRHDIIYLVKKDKKTTVIKVFSIKDRKIFLKKINEWVLNNKVTITEESALRLQKELVSN